MKIFTYASVALLFLYLISCKNDDEVRPINLTGDEILDNVLYNDFNSDGVSLFGYYDMSELNESTDDLKNNFEIQQNQIAYQDKGFGLVIDTTTELDGVTIQFKDKNGRKSDKLLLIYFQKDYRSLLSRERKIIDFVFEDLMPDFFYYEVRGFVIDHEVLDGLSMEIGEAKEVVVDVRSWGGNLEFNNNLQLYDFWYAKQHSDCPSGTNCSSPKIVDEYNWLNNQEIKSSSYRTCLKDGMKDFTNVKAFELNSDGSFYMDYEAYFETDYELYWSTEFRYEIDKSLYWSSCGDEVTRVNTSAKYFGKWSYDRENNELTIVIYSAKKRNSDNIEKEVEIPNGWVFMNRAKVTNEGEYLKIENKIESIDDFSYSGGIVEVVEKELWRFKK